MMTRYYDAHLYLANWGTHQIMLRLPLALLDRAIAEQYCVGDEVVVTASGESLILDLVSERDSEDWYEGDADSLSAIAGVRSELAAGDLRAPTWVADRPARARRRLIGTKVPARYDEVVSPSVTAGLASSQVASRRCDRNTCASLR